ALLRGQAMTVVAPRDLEGDVWRCTQCAHVSATARDACPVCGGDVEQIAFVQLLPLLARRGGATIEIVGKGAAERLQPLGGVGAILRYVTAPAAAQPAMRPDQEEADAARRGADS
ncbi:MAG: hypothetical protein ACRDGN_13055, partial [bacterium]